MWTFKNYLQNGIKRAKKRVEWSNPGNFSRSPYFGELCSHISGVNFSEIHSLMWGSYDRRLPQLCPIGLRRLFHSHMSEVRLWWGGEGLVGLRGFSEGMDAVIVALRWRSNMRSVLFISIVVFISSVKAEFDWREIGVWLFFFAVFFIMDFYELFLKRWYFLYSIFNGFYKLFLKKWNRPSCKYYPGFW